MNHNNKKFDNLNKIVEDKKNNQIILKDFYLATFLKAKGLDLLDVIRVNPHQCLFVFKDQKNRQILVEDFLFGRTQIEPHLFIKAMKELKQLIYSK